MSTRSAPFTGYRRAPFAGMFHAGPDVGIPFEWVILGAVACRNPPGAAIEVCTNPPGARAPRHTEWRGLPALSAPPDVAGYALACRWRDIRTRRAMFAHPREYKLMHDPGPAPRPRDARGRFAPLPDVPPNRWPDGSPTK